MGYRPVPRSASEPVALDERDRTLLALLTADARASVASLGRAVHLSESAVRRRIARLEDSGIVAGYTVVRPPSGAGVRAVLEVRLEGARCRDLAEAIADSVHVREVLSLAGEIDTLVLLDAPDIAAIGGVADRIAALAFVQRVTTRPVLDTVLRR